MSVRAFFLVTNTNNLTTTEKRKRERQKIKIHARKERCATLKEIKSKMYYMYLIRKKQTNHHVAFLQLSFGC